MYESAEDAHIESLIEEIEVEQGNWIENLLTHKEEAE